MKLTENTLKRLVEEVMNEWPQASLKDSVRATHINKLVDELKNERSKRKIKEAVKDYCKKNGIYDEEEDY